MKYNLKCFIQRIVVVLIFSFMQANPVVAQDVSEDNLSDSSIAVIKSVLQTPRFVQNTGQWPSDVQYVSRTAGGYIAFMTDSIVVHRFANVNIGDNAMDEYGSTSAGTFLSEKKTRASYALPMEGKWEKRTSVIQIRSEENNRVPIALGKRSEHVNIFPVGSADTRAYQAPSFDTLVYLSIRPGYDLIITTHNTVLLWLIVPQNVAPKQNGNNLPEDLEALLASLRQSELAFPIEALMLSSHDRIVYSTLLGGEKTDWVLHILPMSKNVYLLCGSTRSTDFPLTEAAYDKQFEGDTSSIYSNQIFFTAIDLLKHELVFSTYFGGSGIDGISSVVRNSLGHIVFAGSAWSDDLPTTQDAYQRQYRGNGDGFVAAIDSTGSRLIFCTYFGGSGIENLEDMKIDDQGNIVVMGLTDSWNFPTTPGALQRNYGGGDDDIFVAKLNGDASQLLFSTFIGGSGWDEGYNLQLLGEQGILIAGATNSDNFPVTPDALFPSRLGYDEGCVLILSNDGRKLVYSTYIAWDAHENVWEAHLNKNDVLTIFGITTSTNLPTTPTSFQQRKGGYPVHNQLSADFYILRFALGSADEMACTYLGGAGSERYAEAFHVLPGGNFLTGGMSLSADYPVTDTLLRGSPTKYSAVLSIFDSTLSYNLLGVRLGGSDHSNLSCSLIENGIVLLSGYTYSTDFPLTTDAWQNHRIGETDGFFTILDISDIVMSTSSKSPAIPTDLLHSIYPNPATRSVSLPFMLSSAGHVQITFQDMLGRVVAMPVDSFLPAGEHRSIFNTTLLPSGTYIVRMLTERGQQSRLMQVIGR